MAQRKRYYQTTVGPIAATRLADGRWEFTYRSGTHRLRVERGARGWGGVCYTLRRGFEARTLDNVVRHLAREIATHESVPA